MPIPEDHLQRGTDLFADLTSLDEWLQALLPGLARMTERERQTFVTRLCGYDPALPDHVQQLLQGVADLLGGLACVEARAVVQ